MILIYSVQYAEVLRIALQTLIVVVVSKPPSHLITGHLLLSFLQSWQTIDLKQYHLLSTIGHVHGQRNTDCGALPCANRTHKFVRKWTVSMDTKNSGACWGGFILLLAVVATPSTIFRRRSLCDSPAAGRGALYSSTYHTKPRKTSAHFR